MGHGGEGRTVQLYTAPGETIPISVKPFPVDNLVLEEEKVKWAVKRLRNNRSGGPSGMQAEHLKWWIATARKAEKDRETDGKEGAATTTEGGRTETAAAQEGTESYNWERVVDLVQSAFCEGKLA